MLRSVSRQTTAAEAPSFFINSGYHSRPYSIPCEPFLSDERNDFNIPQLTLLKSFEKASASSASRVSWLMNINGAEGCRERGTSSSSLSASFFVDSSAMHLFPIVVRVRWLTWVIGVHHYALGPGARSIITPNAGLDLPSGTTLSPAPAFYAPLIGRCQAFSVPPPAKHPHCARAVPWDSLLSGDVANQRGGLRAGR